MRLKPRKPERTVPVPTSAELDILSALWRLEPATVREVHEKLAKNCGYTTTLKQMQLMTEKGLLVRSERFRSHVYESAVPREELQKRIAGDLMNRVFGGSAANLVMGALAARPASAGELDEIRKLIEAYSAPKGGSK
jgi:BlaI family penicillinase repressor